MKDKKEFHRILVAFNHYLVFFLMVAFVITCCMMLFVSTLSKDLDITLTNDNLNAAAKLTFINVIFISFLFTVTDAVRRKIMVGRPVGKITDAAEKIMHGDFNVRIKPIRGVLVEKNFNQIINCFNQLAEELASVETLRTDFVANVSHEIKTPLSVIQNYGTLLQTPTLTEEKRVEYAKAITESSRRLSDLVTNILKLNRLENQQIYPENDEYNLSEQLCEGLLRYESVWEKSKIEIETDIEENVFVVADSELLSLVWNNLFSNAFKFTDKGGKVSVSLKSDGNEISVEVADTGCGMSKEVGEHIFEKFYQGDTSHATQGNGLGLPLVKRIMDITGGEISVSSTVGVGSTFVIKLRRYYDEKG